MLFALSPTANVFVAIRPLEGAFTVLLAVLKVTFVLAAITPEFHASTFHVAHSEFTLIHLVQVGKVVLAETLKLPIYKVSIVVASILPFESPLAVFLSFKELASVLG